MFFGTFLYALGFVGNFVVPAAGRPAARATGQALAIDSDCCSLFALQHSVMARPAFKRWLDALIPEPAERSTYVLLSSLALIAAVLAAGSRWAAVVWEVEEPTAARVLYGALRASAGLLVLLRTFLINHFDLFGLRQVWLQLRGQPYTPLAVRARPALQAGSPSALRRLALRLLGDADDDRSTTCCSRS